MRKELGGAPGGYTGQEGEERSANSTESDP